MVRRLEVARGASCRPAMCKFALNTDVRGYAVRIQMSSGSLEQNGLGGSRLHVLPSSYPES